MYITYDTLCEIGLSRKSNQDRITAHSNDKISIFAVADGMGGHSKGEFASEAVIKEIDILWNEISDFSGDFQTAVDMVISTLEKANNSVFKFASSEKIICGSTASVLLIYNDLYAVINVGDSPVYHADKQRVFHDSTEHSYDQIMLKSTLISPDELDSNRNGKLVQAVGIKENIIPSVKTGALKGNETFLICSDGVSRYFSDKQIFNSLRRNINGALTISELLAYLKGKVYNSGAADNLSAIVICANNNEDNVSKKHRTIIIISIVAVIIFILWALTNIIILL